jgi:cyclophilin family peptidyl-prolyl cis-trans isomerase
MPRQQKRARQKAARAARLAEIQRQRKRQNNIRRATIGVFLAAIAVGIFALVGGFSNAKPSSATGSTTTTSNPSTSTTGSTTSTTSSATSEVVKMRQDDADKISHAAGCPLNTATRVNTLSWKTAPAMTINTSDTYEATVRTDAGTFVMTLDPAEAPIAVNNFVFLAEHKFYNCVIFHRVIPGFVVQGGDPTGTGDGGPGYQFTEEGPPKTANSADQYPLYSVAMANSSSGTTDPSTNGSQFFIVTGSSGESLPPDYILFGKVTSGLSVVQQINNDGSSAGVPPTVTHRMLSVTITKS